MQNLWRDVWAIRWHYSHLLSTHRYSDLIDFTVRNDALRKRCIEKRCNMIGPNNYLTIRLNWAEGWPLHLFLSRFPSYMLLPHRQTFCRRWLTRRLTPTGPSHLLLFLDISAINTKLRKAVNSAEGSLWYGGEMLGGYLPRVPPPRLIPWRVCPWVPIYLFSLHLKIWRCD